MNALIALMTVFPVATERPRRGGSSGQVSRGSPRRLQASRSSWMAARSRPDQRRTQEPQDAPPREIARISDPLVASSLAFHLVVIRSTTLERYGARVPVAVLPPSFFAQNSLLAASRSDRSRCFVVPSRCRAPDCAV